MISVIQHLALDIFSESWKHIYSLDMEHCVCFMCSTNRHFLTYLLTYLLTNLFHSDLTKHLSNTTDKSCSSHGVKGQGKRFFTWHLNLSEYTVQIYIWHLCRRFTHYKRKT